MQAKAIGAWRLRRVRAGFVCLCVPAGLALALVLVLE